METHSALSAVCARHQKQAAAWHRLHMHMPLRRCQIRAAEWCVYVQARALGRKANKAEKMKVQKDGSLMWTEIEDLAALIRSGKVRIQPPSRGLSGQFWN